MNCSNQNCINSHGAKVSGHSPWNGATPHITEAKDQIHQMTGGYYVTFRMKIDAFTANNLGPMEYTGDFMPHPKNGFFWNVMN